jgi:2,4-diketo-3-deoxy-L-fuconate hydrolase
MKLIRYGSFGAEKPGVLIDGKRYDTSAFFNDYNEEFFLSNGLERLKEYIKDDKTLKLIDNEIRWGSPVARPSKIVCIGLNYKDHALETNAPIPDEPVIFMKSTSSLVGPNDEVIIPRNSYKTDWEVELAVVIGKYTSYVEEKDAMEAVAGYILHNDISERAFQLERNGTWDKGKGCNTFAPLGPFMATKDEISDPHQLRLWLKLNGKIVQDSNTSNFIFKIPFLISYVSQFMALLPGDVISTGTPHGVGMAMKPEPVYLKAGDKMELGIDQLGISRQQVKSYGQD